MMELADRYIKVKEHVAALAEKAGRDSESVTLVVVTKTRSTEEIESLYDAGCRHFGENRLPEALEKKEQLPDDIHWHMIGSIQSKKVPKLVEAKFSLVHSVDQPRLAEKISKKSVELGLETKILLQANTSGEEVKHGLTAEEWKEHFKDVVDLPGVKIEGFMTMAPLTEDKKWIEATFLQLAELRDELVDSWDRVIPHLSMGMTHDYPLAIKQGATLVRLGSAIFSDETPLWSAEA